MTCFTVIHGGALSLIQDSGRFGQTHLGLTSGGVADEPAYYWLNRLLSNSANASCVEITLGGLKLESQAEQVICMTGGQFPLLINGKQKRNWCCHQVTRGDIIEVGYSQAGTRAYLGVHKGFIVTPQFGSTSTVTRECVGGLNGAPLTKGDTLVVTDCIIPEDKPKLLALGQKEIPRYRDHVLLRLVLGYQHEMFSAEQKAQCCESDYYVSKQWNRMGYRLEGKAIHLDDIALPSEGICYGAVQVPPDGQPIILLNDRQTLGGYPKIGSILSLDAYQLAQCGQNARVCFKIITYEQAIDALQQEQEHRQSISLKRVYNT